MKKINLLFALAFSALSSPAFADKLPSYTYVEGDYATRDFEGGLQSDGFKLKGSFEINESFFAIADLTSTSGDSSDADGTYDIDLTSQHVGIGWKHDQPDGLSWFVSYSVGKFEFDETDTYLNGDIDEYTFERDIDVLHFGIRAQFTDNLELNIGLTSNDIEFAERENGYQFGFVYETGDQWQFIFERSTIAGDFDVTTTSLGMRRSFSLGNEKQSVSSSSSLASEPMIDNKPSYTFIEGAFDSRGFDDGEDTDGFHIEGSYELGSYFFLTANIASTSDEVVAEGDKLDVDFSSKQYGVGVKLERDNGFSWFASYTLGNMEIEIIETRTNGDRIVDKDDFDVDTLLLGLRTLLSNQFELNFAISSNDVEGLQREAGYQIGLIYSVSNDWHVVFERNTIAGDLDFTTTSLGVRKTF